MSVDLSPIISQVVLIIAGVVGLLGSAVLLKLRTKFGLQIDTAQQAAYDTALTKSLTFGVTKAQSLIATHGWDHVDVHSAVVGTALSYLANNFGGTVKAMGLTTNLNDAGDKLTLTSALERALPNALAQAAASPATPPATAPAQQTQADLPAAPTVQVVAAPAPTAA